MSIKSELDRQRLTYTAFRYDPVAGMYQGYNGTSWSYLDKVRYNGISGTFEGWDGTGWVIVSGGGDTSFRIESVAADGTVVIKGGYIALTSEGIMATYDGAGTAEADFGVAISFDLDSLIGSPVNGTTYYLYVDLYSLPSATTLTDSGRKLIPVISTNFVLMTSDFESVDSFRYAKIGVVKRATGVWSTTVALSYPDKRQDTILDVSPLDPNPEETFIYYTRSDFRIDQKRFFGSTTGTNTTGPIILGVGQEFISSNILGATFLADNPVINNVQVRLLYSTGAVDLAPTITVSTDGGSNWTSSYSAFVSGNFVVADFSMTTGTTSTDFRIKVVSSTASTSLLGFGANLVQDAVGSYTGDSTYEARVITPTEASTGTITLSTIRFMPGAHQLHCNYNGHDFMAPDFVELGGGVVQFALNFFNTGDTAKFYVSYGLVNIGNAPITINNFISSNSTLGSIAIPSGFTLDKPWLEIPAGAVITGAGNIETTGTITGLGTLATSGTVVSTATEPTQSALDRATVSQLSSEQLTVTTQAKLDCPVNVNPSQGDKDFRVYGMATNALIFGDASTSRVGLGTDTPSYSFHQAGNTAGLANARLASGISSQSYLTTYVAFGATSSTFDICRLLDGAGSAVGNNHVCGHFYVYVVDATTGGNCFTGVYSIVTTGNGTSPAVLNGVSTVTRGTSPVSTIQIANDGTFGAIKLTVTTVAGFASGIVSRVTFIGSIL